MAWIGYTKDITHKHVYEISATFCMSDSSYIGCDRTGSEKQVLFWHKNMAEGGGSWTILPSPSADKLAISCQTAFFGVGSSTCSPRSTATVVTVKGPRNFAKMK